MQREDLHNLFETHTTLCDGTLGRYPYKKVRVEVEKGSTPKQIVTSICTAHILLVTSKQELLRLNTKDGESEAERENILHV